MKSHIGSEVNCEFLFCRERSEFNPCDVLNLCQIDELSRTDPKFREGLEVHYTVGLWNKVKHGCFM